MVENGGWNAIHVARTLFQKISNHVNSPDGYTFGFPKDGFSHSNDPTIGRICLRHCLGNYNLRPSWIGWWHVFVTWLKQNSWELRWQLVEAGLKKWLMIGPIGSTVSTSVRTQTYVHISIYIYIYIYIYVCVSNYVCLMHRWDFLYYFGTARSTILFVKVSEFGSSLAENDTRAKSPTENPSLTTFK